MDAYESSFAAAAFHPRFEGGKSAGTLRIQQRAVRFDGGGQSVSLPLEGLDIRVGGASDRIVFFAHPRHPEWSIYTADRAVLDDASFRDNPHAAGIVGKIRSGKRKRVATGFAVVGIIVAALWGLLLLKDPLVRMVVRRVPPQLEQKLGDLALRQILLTNSTITDARVTEPLDEMLQTITTGAGLRQTFRIHVIDDDAVNAFALPGGHLLFNTGLLLAAESGEEIAGVMAHEIAHVTEQHSLQQIVSTIGVFALVQALLGDVSGIIAVAADGGARLLTKSFSRDAESEADEQGLALLQAAQIDPRGMLSFFEKMKAREQESGVAAAGEALALLSTHPATSRRIEQLTAEVDRMSKQTEYRPINLDREKLAAAINEAR